MSRKARLNRVPLMPALGIDNRGREPCVILGERSGVSESLSSAARARAGWRELEALHELREALPTGAEARQQREQEKRRRHRARRAADTAPKVPPPTRPKPDFDQRAADLMADLGADFFEPAEPSGGF